MKVKLFCGQGTLRYKGGNPYREYNVKNYDEAAQKLIEIAQAEDGNITLWPDGITADELDEGDHRLEYAIKHGKGKDGLYDFSRYNSIEDAGAVIWIYGDNYADTGDCYVEIIE